MPPHPPSLQSEVATTLDRYLDPASTAPIGIALSGGGDSVALLALATPWARVHGRPLIAFTVDHALHPDSPRWTAFAADLSRRLGAEPVTLRWSGPKPATGLPAAARAARHALIADAARAHGVRVVLFAHTADDIAEGEWMRSRHTPLGQLREWSPSPAWPEGRDVFLLRPLLTASRATLRGWLRSERLPWIDDPANADPRFLRTHARAARQTSDSSDSSDPFFQAAVAIGRTDRTLRTPPFQEIVGALVLSRASLSARTLAAACLCVSGEVTPPRGHQLARLAARLAYPGEVVATLAGARVQSTDTGAMITREPGRAGLPSLPLQPHVEAVWDGRWRVATTDRDITVRPLAGLAARLSPDARRALAELPAPIRPTLPAFISADGVVSCPLLEPTAHAALSLVADRFAAATGEVQCEADILAHPPLLAR